MASQSQRLDSSYLKKCCLDRFFVGALGRFLGEIRDALHPTPGDSNWLGFVFAILLAGPSILTAVYWRTLVWRGKPALIP
jgi:hypothetical protein